jgi:hypothetical protein
MNSLSRAFARRLSAPLKISRIAASSVTIVKITSAPAVTSPSVGHAVHPSSVANEVAAARLTSNNVVT